ncbi:hypothetical protein [Bifidobacterium samirii]|uniref:Uncharacterized protein n=1 Tax=Bifidobacterium samirii TaxID=2306974 RepID=A0A430FJD0_9BIFI|nr:hypothetical protein [Bifidobacterium samirii]RSX52994.1 hypothetical protein D2E24_1665 [Bifidobacterium samirii]
MWDWFAEHVVELAGWLLTVVATVVGWVTEHRGSRRRDAERREDIGTLEGQVAALRDQAASLQEANELAARALRRDTEDSHVEWAVGWDEDRCSLVLTNTGRDVAHDVAVVVNAVLPGSGGRFHRAVTSVGDVPDGGSVAVPVPEAVEDRKRVNGMLAGNPMGRYMMVMQGARWRCRFDVDVMWKTDEGFPRVRHLDHAVS